MSGLPGRPRRGRGAALRPAAALFPAMAGALVLGMGMPTLPAYLIIISILGPALQEPGTSVLTAHMFVFHYGVASSLTPPVAIAAYAAAPVANANLFTTSLMALRLGAAKVVTPFAFAFHPSLLLVWRSLLFVPVLEERLLAGASGRGADAVVLDLEAGVAEARRPEARAALPGAVGRLSAEAEVAVRINPLWLDAVRDLDACVIEGVAALHLARCETPMDVVAVDRLVSELEAERGLPPGAIPLVGMLESPGAVLRAAEIAGASRRMAGLTLGVEDYATAMGRPATEALLRPAGLQVIQAARSAGLEPLVVPASIADFRDLDALEAAAADARSLGSTGGYAVHPGQVEVLNRVFAPTGDEVDWARRVLDAAGRAEAEGRGVFQVDGRMVDRPLVVRARGILRDAEGRGRGGPQTGG